MIEAVIFDMDGLLIDSEPLWARAYRAAFKTLGIQITDKDMVDIMGKRIPESVEHFYRKYAVSGPAPKAMEKLVEADMIAMIKQEGKLLPGVHHAFKVCRQAGLPMAIASSSLNSMINAVMDTTGIRKYFEHIHSAEHEPFGKPHPGIFITTAKLLGVIPEHCLVFEDSPSGVLAAKAAKMKCIAVPEPHVKSHPFIQIADVILGSLGEFDKGILKTV
jgi:HAD superfamily hydrolase (TIGR01509 family)